jgi:hypothetical protein
MTPELLELMNLQQAAGTGALSPIMMGIIGGLYFANSFVQTMVKDAGQNAPAWLKIISQISNTVAFNFGKAKNEEKATEE